MVIIASVIALLLIGFIIMATWDKQDHVRLSEELKRLQLEYEAALKGKDRKAALKAGRSYYAMGRENKSLTVYDEQVLANDLSTMPMEVYFVNVAAEKSRDSVIPETL